MNNNSKFAYDLKCPYFLLNLFQPNLNVINEFVTEKDCKFHGKIWDSNFINKKCILEQKKVA
jgi:hypothetical protein